MSKVLVWVVIMAGLFMWAKQCSAQTTAIPDGRGGFVVYTPSGETTQIIRNPVGLGYTIYTTPSPLVWRYPPPPTAFETLTGGSIFGVPAW